MRPASNNSQRKTTQESNPRPHVTGFYAQQEAEEQYPTIGDFLERKPIETRRLFEEIICKLMFQEKEIEKK